MPAYYNEFDRPGGEMSYDSKCYDLAECFLQGGLIGFDHTMQIDRLAQHIQDAIEDWIAANPPRGVTHTRSHSEK